MRFGCSEVAVFLIELRRTHGSNVRPRGRESERLLYEPPLVSRVRPCLSCDQCVCSCGFSPRCIWRELSCEMAGSCGKRGSFLRQHHLLSYISAVT